MAKHNELGKRGEELAFLHLMKEGFVIHERNWRFKKEEIDIIAEKDNRIIFVEVKTRSSDDIENPEDAVTIQKQRFLINAGDAYIQSKEIELEAQFDIITIILNPISGQFLLNHIPEAFHPTLNTRKK
jgi:putative endonuclease